MNIKETVLLEIIPFDENCHGKFQDVIRVVKWEKGPPQLEKRNFWFDEEENIWKMGKARGFVLKDLDLINARLEEIKKALVW